MAGGFETVQFVEIDPYCQKVLAKNFPGVPIHDDIRSFRPGSADIITGGFPCQPFSVAGKQSGKADDRDLWPEMFRVISAVRPTWVIGENVAGFVNMELDRSLSDLEALGYACRAFVISACATDARHRRDRVWIVAHAKHVGRDATKEREGAAQRGGCREARSEQTGKPSGLRTPRVYDDVAHARRDDVQGRSLTASNGSQRSEPVDESPARLSAGGGRDGCRWLPEPPVGELVDGLSDGLVRFAGRVATGVPNRVNKLKGLGNAVVPQVVAEIARAIRLAA